MSLLQASHNDFAGPVSSVFDSPRRNDSLLQEEPAADRQAISAFGSRRVMVHKNKVLMKQSATGKLSLSNFDDPKMLLTRYNGKITDGFAKIDAQVVINGGESMVK